MCGFVCLLRYDRGPIRADSLERAIATLRHRGPDHLASRLVAPGVGMAHARLRVIDPSEAANQPMISGDGQLAVVFNGEIYNFRELRAALSGTGSHFRTHSDTEVILAQYRVHGEAGLEALEGMFAIALWDSAEQKLILARDRTGKKPLYVYDDGTTVVAASQPKAILATGYAQSELDERAFAPFLSYGYVPGAATFYRRIQKLEAGTRRILGRQGWTTHRYWDLPNRPPESVSVEEAKHEVRRVVTAAVERRLVADVPVGAFLSGGIDSTIVTGLMARAVPGRVKTFSIGFEGPAEFDETAQARRTSVRFNTDHTQFIVRPSHFEVIEDLATYFDEPCGDSSALPSFVLCRMASEQVTVALNGDGGDESFGGYSRLVVARDRRELPSPVRATLAALGGFAIDHLGRLPGALRLGGRLERAAWSDAEHFGQLNRLLPATRVAALLQRDKRSIEDEVSGPFGVAFQASAPTRDPVNRLLRVHTAIYLVEDLNVKMDRASMAHGLETRSPFLDREVMELAYRLPGGLKLHDEPPPPVDHPTRLTTSKWILRETFRDLLSADILDRPKKGFCVPLETWFRGELREPTRDLLSSGVTGNFLDPRRVNEALDAHDRGEDRSNELWLLLQLELWLRAGRQRNAAVATGHTAAM